MDKLWGGNCERVTKDGLQNKYDHSKNISGLQYFPTIWRATKLVFISKPGIIQYSSPKDYRSNCLSAFLLKTFKRIIDIHIRSKHDNFRFSKNQHAYLKGKSIDIGLHDVVQTIGWSLYFKEYTLGQFLDIEGDFNTIHSGAIRQALIGANVEADFVN